MKVWPFFLTVIITGALVGGGMYFWQRSQFESFNEAIENLKLENNSLKEKVGGEEVENEETSQLLSLDSNSSVCIKEPTQLLLDIGSTRTIYPVADEYKTSADDYHQITGLFTAEACGKGRLDELFHSKTFTDVAISTDHPNSDLISYLKENDFVCSEKEMPESDCNRWYNSGSVSLKVMTGLRKWSKMIYGSDCTNCG